LKEDLLVKGEKENFLLKELTPKDLPKGGGGVSLGKGETRGGKVPKEKTAEFSLLDRRR